MSETKVLTILVAITLVLTAVNTVGIFMPSSVAVTGNVAAGPAAAGQPARVQVSVDDDPSIGSADAPVTIIEFSDFQCPFCRKAAFTLKPYLKEFRNDVRFVFFNFPLDSACNPAIQQTMHPVSCVAAKAVLCAEKQGKFWELHDEAFENQKRLSRSTLLELATKFGLDTAALEKCMSSDEISAVLKRDVDEGNRLEVKGTPAVYLNGRFLRDWPDSERLRMVIESALSSPKPE